MIGLESTCGKRTDVESAGRAIRTTLLEVVQELCDKGTSFQASAVLSAVAQRFTLKPDGFSEALLTAWYDLFRAGLVAPGYNLANPDLPFVHLTERGRAVLANLSRDPHNLDGYVGYIESIAWVDGVGKSYAIEAARAFNFGAYRAAAVMIGCAAECLVLLLRHAVASKLAEAGSQVPKGLADWKLKLIRDALATYLDKEKGRMPVALRESYSAHWTSFMEQIRRVRNDAGHPQSIDSVTENDVYASLLIFPELAELFAQLGEWISTSPSGG